MGASDLARLTCAFSRLTNADLAQTLKENLFGEDLCYRLNLAPVDIPPCASVRTMSNCWPKRC
jgi:transcriptional regulator with GAF, ATPase, and Fis domain